MVAYGELVLPLSPSVLPDCCYFNRRTTSQIYSESPPYRAADVVLKALQDGPSSHQETSPTMGSQALPPARVQTSYSWDAWGNFNAWEVMIAVTGQGNISHTFPRTPVGHCRLNRTSSHTDGYQEVKRPEDNRNPQIRLKA